MLQRTWANVVALVKLLNTSRAVQKVVSKVFVGTILHDDTSALEQERTRWIAGGSLEWGNKFRRESQAPVLKIVDLVEFNRVASTPQSNWREGFRSAKLHIKETRKRLLD